MWLRDITRRHQREAERASLEAQLRQMHKMESIGTLAGGISHEFNNMLVPMIGLTELVAEELEDGSPEKQNLMVALEAGQRATALVGKIMQFSRLEEEIDRDNVDLRAVWHDVKELLQGTLPATIAMHEAISAEAALVRADKTEMHQVLLNIIGNAADAIGPARGTIEFGLSVESRNESFATRYQIVPPGEYAHIWVEDSGEGIDEECLARIFDPFFTTKQVGEGTGMGLAVVHAIITRDGGAIDVRSAKGEGTRFDFYLPFASATTEEAQAATQ